MMTVFLFQGCFAFKGKKKNARFGLYILPYLFEILEQISLGKQCISSSDHS